MTQTGWKYQELTQKYNIALKLQYIHILTVVYVKILKKLVL